MKIFYFRDFSFTAWRGKDMDFGNSCKGMSSCCKQGLFLDHFSLLWLEGSNSIMHLLEDRYTVSSQTDLGRPLLKDWGANV
jgi:hypothetical protein